MVHFTLTGDALAELERKKQAEKKAAQEPKPKKRQVKKDQ